MPLAVILLMIAVPRVAAAGQEPTWFDLYDEAIKHIQQGDFEQAETKLIRAQKAGPAPGRNVLRYGSLRPPYFPDYYLGIVYVSTARPQEALAAFERARKANLNAREAEFRAITTFEAQARSAISRAKNAPPEDVKRPPAAPDPPAPNPPPAPDYRKQAADLLTSARTQLAQRSFDAAEQTATLARNLAIKYNLPDEQPQAEALLKRIAGSRLAARVEGALERRDAAAARRELTVLVTAAPDYSSDELRGRVEGLEREVRGSSLQRSAVRAFLLGSYDQAIALLSEAEAVVALAPRGHFYRACSLAALAAASPDPSRDPRLDSARQSLARAGGGTDFREDLRYVSPKVKQLLGIK